MKSKHHVAIIGMAVRFPQASDYDRFWSNLEGNVNSIREIPAGRWDIHTFHADNIHEDNRSISKWGGFLQDIEWFDNRFFGISRREARHMDPQQRLLLEETWRCIEDAGVPLERLQKALTSVFAGVMGVDYAANFFTPDVPTDAFTCLGNYDCILANRISHLFGFRGKSLSIPAACASSLIALHEAKQSIQRGECEFAIAAGVNLNIHPMKYISFSKSRMLSPDGQCKTFDKDANGYVPGEGVGVVLCRDLERAVKERNRIYGIIKGSCVNHCGKGFSITSPSVAAQKAVICAAHRDAQISPRTVTYVEAHGTGTSLGDPIEIEALTRAFRERTTERNFCKIGSVKTNIGHLEAAAGIAGVIKILMMMRHRKIPMTLNVQKLNPLLEIGESPFSIADRLEQWHPCAPDAPLCAGVSSFGFGGQNCHMLLESFDYDGKTDTEDHRSFDGTKAGPHIFGLSAKSARSLEAMIGKWRDFTESTQFETFQLHEISATLMTGRQSFPFRYGALIGDKDELKSFLGQAGAFAGSPDSPEWRIQIGELFLKRYEDIEPLMGLSCIRQHLQPPSKRIVKSGVDRKLINGFFARRWPKRHRKVYSFMAGYALFAALLDLCGKPKSISGQGNGIWVALTLSGVLTFTEAVKILCGEKRPRDIKPRRPRIPFFDSSHHRLITPWHIDAAYVRHLVLSPEIPADTVAYYRNKARLLIENQHTFRKYLNEWNDALAQTGYDIRELLADPKRSHPPAPAAGKKGSLVCLIVMSCLRQLKNKWGLTGDEGSQDPKIIELLDLISDGIIPKSVLVDILSKNAPDADAIAERLNSRQHLLDPAKRYCFLKGSSNRGFKIRDFTAWIERQASGNAPAPKGHLCLIYEKLEAIRSGKRIDTSFGSELVSSFKKMILALWLKGASVAWERLFPDSSFRNLALPVYQFQRNYLWIREDSGGTATGTEMAQAASTLPTPGTNRFKRHIAPHEPMVRDHLIHGVPVLPGAWLCRLGLESIEMATGTRPITIRDLVFHAPGVIRGRATLEAEILPSEDRFRIVADDKVLCTGAFEKARHQGAVARDFPELREDSTFAAQNPYEMFLTKGYAYGETLQVVKAIWRGEQQVVISLHDPDFSEEGRHRLNYRLLDGALQSILSVAFSEDNRLARDDFYLPYAIGALRRFGAFSETCYLVIDRRTYTQTEDGLGVEADLFDADGSKILALEAVRFRKVSKSRWIRSTAKTRSHGSKAINGLADVPPDADLHEPAWIAEELRDEDMGADQRMALLLHNHGELGRQLNQMLPRHYHRILNGAPGDAGVAPKADAFHIDLSESDSSSFQSVMDAIKAEPAAGGEPVDIYYLWCHEELISPPSGVEDIMEKQNRGLKGLFLLAKAIARAGILRPVSIVVPTNATQVITALDRAEGYASGGISGLAETIRVESPNITVKIVDFCPDDRATAADKASILCRESLSSSPGGLVAYRNSGRYIRTFVPCRSESQKGEPVLRDRGVYVILGGGGVLGIQLATWIQELVEARIALVGRSPLSPQKEKELSDASNSGGSVSYFRADITDREEMASAIDSVKSRFGPINGIFHLGGLIRDEMIAQKHWSTFQAVMAPKITGACIINELTRSEPLDLFVVFSSIVSVTGNVGQADYASANSFLDCFIHHRSRNDFPGKSISINWTLWEEGGMGATDHIRSKFLARGIRPISTRSGFACLGQILDISERNQTVVLGEGSAFGEQDKRIDARKPASDFKGGAEEAGRQEVEAYLQRLIAGKIGKPAPEVSKEDSFFALGVESLILMEIMDTLNKEYDDLSPTLLFEHPNIQKLGAFLIRNGRKKKESIVHKKNEEANHLKDSHELNFPYEIAVIGMSGRFPKSKTIDEYWDNLIDGRDCIEEIRADRWDFRQFKEIYAKWGGFIDDVDRFDPLFFKISPEQAHKMDPQQRLFLQCVWETMEHAGYGDRAQYERDTVGLFVGVMWNEYSAICNQEGLLKNRYWGPGSLYWAISNRVSYFMDFKGPSIALDTACSSSLSAVHLACMSILTKECDMAIAGGVNLSIHPGKYIYLSTDKFLSNDGKCRSFGNDGSGYVPGEGVGAVLLKPLRKAIRDGDEIYGVIRGSMTNHGGTSAGFTVPSPDAHEALISKCLERSAIRADQVQYIECHGTGTSLGDPIEIQGLTRAFRKDTQKRQFCPIGSVKSNIGHLEAAAGIAGLIKILLCMRHEKIPQSLHSEVKNPNINFEETPFYVADRAITWKASQSSPRIAGLSSFGAGGSNAHIILESYDAHPAGSSLQASPAPMIVPLSARNPDRLEEYVSRLRDFLKRHPFWDSDFKRIAHTLQVGRKAYDERLAVIAGTLDELIEKLDAVLEGTGDVDGVIRGNAKSRKGSPGPTGGGEPVHLNRPGERKQLFEMASTWVSGAPVDWHRLHGGEPVRKIGLPTYPFARDSYWARSPEPAEKAGDERHHAILHPLMQQNTSDFYEQRYSSIFNGGEFFLADHVVNGRQVLPGVAYLEMARAAVSDALGGPDMGRGAIKLKNVVWHRPVSVNGKPVKVHIRLKPASNNHIRYEIYSAAATSAEPVVYSRGSAELTDHAEAPELDLDALRSNCGRKRLSAAQCYDAFCSMGIEYGPGHRGLEQVYTGEDQVLAKLSLPGAVHTTYEHFIMHPSIMDSALQASIALLETEHVSQPLVPFTLKQMDIYDRCTPSMWAHIRKRHNRSRDGGIHTFDVDMADENGKICVRMTEVSTRTMNGGTDAAKPQEDPGILLAHPIWEERSISPGDAQTPHEQHLVVLCGLDPIPPEAMERQLDHVRFTSINEETGAIDEAYRFHAGRVFELIQGILGSRPKGNVLVQVLVSNQGEGALLSGLSGLLKTARLENPRFRWQLISVPPSQRAAGIIKIIKDNALTPNDERIDYRDGRRWTAGWKELPLPAPAAGLPWREKGVYLITGGTGSLGLIFAEEIARQTRKPTLILTGRSALSREKESKLAPIQRLGAKPLYRQVDMADAGAVEDLLEGIVEDFGHINGIIHCAGVIKDSFIIHKTPEEVDAVLAPKVSGAVNLDRASKMLSLDFFVLFSSVSGAIGNAGQADYAAANAFMDAFANYRAHLVASHQRHGLTLSINWPLWRHGGMHVDEATEKMLLQRLGMIPMGSAAGLKAFYDSIASPHSQVLVMEGQLPKMRRLFFPMSTSPPEVESEAPGSTAIAADPDTGALGEKTKHALIRLVSEQLKVKSEDIDLDEELNAYGFDSVSLTEFANNMNQAFNLELLPTLFFDYPTLRGIATHLIEAYRPALETAVGMPRKMEGSGTEAEEPVEAKASSMGRLYRFKPEVRRTADATTGSAACAVAIVGISGQFPMARDLDEFWDNLEKGRDCIGEIPASRWDWKQFLGDPAVESNKSRVKWGGFIDGIDEFDPLFFGISPKEAERMDPQQRLLMMHAWNAVEDAGYSAQSLSGTPMAIFVGTARSGYADLLARADVPVEAYSVTGALPSVGPNRMSYFLNIHGPSEPVETACSSSLIAIHRAVLAITGGTCETAIAGGVNTILTPEYHISFDKAGMLCEDGRCKTFSNKANGYVRGEGVGMIFLKELSRAEKDQDHIYGVIRGTAENHGGRANSLTAPNTRAQARLLTQAYHSAGIDPGTIGYIEAHGTGTELGDPIEINALKEAFSARYPGIADPLVDAPRCGLGSVKTNIGHLELASGIAGVMKVLLQLHHKTLVKSLNCHPLNPYIQLDGSPFYVVKETAPWEPLHDSSGHVLPRRAGVSSFGFGGSNAHVVIEEYIPGKPLPAPIRITEEAPALIVLSAKKPSQLQERAHRLLTRIRQIPIGDADLADLAFTLQTGRDAMDERLAFTATSMADLQEKLEAFLKDQSGIESLYRGQVKHYRDTLTVFKEDEEINEAIEKWIHRKKVGKLLSLWVKGLDIDWSKLYGDAKPRRIALPTYPFARESYWVPGQKPAQKPSRAVSDTDLPVSISTPSVSSKLDEAIRMLKTVFSEALNISGRRIGLDETLGKYGIDSIMALQVTSRLEKTFGPLPKTLLFEFQTIRDLAIYFSETHKEKFNWKPKGQGDAARGAETAPAGQEHQSSSHSTRQSPDRDTGIRSSDTKAPGIAIIGLSGRYPKSKNLEAFWKNLCEGNDCTSQIPMERWDNRGFYDEGERTRGKIHSNWGGFLEDVDRFDPLLFNISPREAVFMDPQERLFLETVWETLEDAGYTRTALGGQNVGVFVGVMYGEYQMMGQSADGSFPAADSFYASIANRVSYFFNFQGPSMALDTMCSSSLTAIHLACESILRKESRIAVAGGVNLSLHPGKYIRLSRGKFLSTDGKCRSFGSGGDGYVPAEGVGALILKPLEQAVEDKDNIYGVIRATAINHGGKTSGYTVPNPNAQADLILSALRKAQVDPGTLGYIEAHGTGTALGDPIEISGLTKAFKAYDENAHLAAGACPVGSVKSNIGHAEAAAGIAAVTKVLLQMKHGKLVPSLHSKELNAHIDFDNSHFYVQRELTDWSAPVVKAGGETQKCPRRSAVSAFGAGGSYANVIIEEYSAHRPPVTPETDKRHIIVLSARKAENLSAYALSLLDYCMKQEPAATSKGEVEARLPTLLKERLVKEASAILGIPEKDMNLEDMDENGFDAIGRMRFFNTIHEIYDLDAPVPMTVQSIEAFAAHLLEHHGPKLADYYDGHFEYESLPMPGRNTARIEEVAYTLQVGRDEMPVRLAIIARNFGELIEKLNRLAANEAEIDGVYRGRIPSDGDRPYVDTGKMPGPGMTMSEDEIAKAWVRGAEIDWTSIYGDDTPNRISLPTYPFSRERYWIGEETEKAPDPLHMKQAAPELHPLVHHNLSTLTECRFLSRFDGGEFFLRDHVIDRRPLFPAAAYLEMARAGGTLACGKSILTIRNVNWISPLRLDGESRDVFIKYESNGTEVPFEVSSQGHPKRGRVHSKGILVLDRPDGNDIELASLADIKGRCHSMLDGTALYARYREAGFHYGPSFQTIRRLHYNSREALADLELKLPPKKLSSAGYLLHPALLDGAFQAVLGAMMNQVSGTAKRYLPFELKELAIFRPPGRKCSAHVTLSSKQTPSESKLKRFEVRLMDQTGMVLVRIRDFTVLESHFEYTAPVSGKAQPENTGDVENRQLLELLRRLENGEIKAAEVNL